MVFVVDSHWPFGRQNFKLLVLSVGIVVLKYTSFVVDSQGPNDIKDKSCLPL